MAKEKSKVASVTAEEPEEYTQNLVYTINIYIQEGGVLNINANDGGRIKFNSGKPQPFPPPQG